MVPLRDMMEALGYDVEWNKETNRIHILWNDKRGIVNNKEKAIKVLRSLASNDPQPINEYVSAEKYIQHNLSFADGRQTMLDALLGLKEANTAVDIKRVLVDGNYVAIQSEYNLFGHKAGFDIFHFEDGKIVEHWDVMETIIPESERQNNNGM